MLALRVLIFQYVWEPVLIQRILIGFEDNLEIEITWQGLADVFHLNILSLIWSMAILPGFIDMDKHL